MPTSPNIADVADRADLIQLDQAGKGVGQLGRLTYWIILGLSGLWFLVSVVASAGLLFALARGSERLNGHSIAELVIGTIVVLQPLLIGALLVRAHRSRTIGSQLSIIGRAALPMSTVALLAAAVAANLYNESLIRAKLRQQMFSGTITYDCSQQSNSVDFDPNEIGPIGLRLTAIRGDRQPDQWLVTVPGQASVMAANFDVDTGSFGGSQGLAWSEADGTHMVAILSFSDILGPYGAETIWVEVLEGNWPEIRDNIAAHDGLGFTCGPNPESYEPPT